MYEELVTLGKSSRVDIDNRRRLRATLPEATVTKLDHTIQMLTKQHPSEVIRAYFLKQEVKLQKFVLGNNSFDAGLQLLNGVHPTEVL